MSHNLILHVTCSQCVCIVFVKLYSVTTVSLRPQETVSVQQERHEKYTRMRHSRSQNSKIFSKEGHSSLPKPSPTGEGSTHARRSLSTVGGDTRVSPQPWTEIDGQSSGQSTPTTVLLSFTFILSPPRRNGVRSHSRCGTQS